ncbi:MAG: aspartate--tRNA ligase [Ruminococcaceae bacterium]|nr:aspartate--tRNA ligase [Oscillospiraceae bacterium]
MAEIYTQSDRRTHYCAELTKSDIGKEVSVVGWVQRQRDLGSLIFIDLRDRSGIIQLAFDEKTDKEIFDKAFIIRGEYVLAAKGTVRSRGEGAINKNIPTGEIEVAVTELKILSVAQTPPFEIVEDSDVKTELRMKHRYLDLRRPDMQRNIMARSVITNIAREYFAEQGFVDIETPNLIKPTPEGARDYLVPSRVHHGKFYALPQSPQIYKQLLMLSGFDRYFQIARCYRDEDLRADRQPEFTQIDLEMSFVTQEQVMEIVEGFLKDLFKKFKGIDLPLPIQKMTYAEAMERFGSDKPDLRFGMELCNISELVKNTEFKVFAGAIENGGSVRAINVKGGAQFSRKEIDAFTGTAKLFKAKGLAWAKNSGGEISSSYAKFLSAEENEAIYTKLGFEDGDLILIVADADKIVFDALGALRCSVAKKLGLIKENDYKLLWVTEFPMFEYDEEEQRYCAMHHPFTMPMPEDFPLLDTDPTKVRSLAYDIVINGTEAGGGSVRIHMPDIQSKIFDLLGLSKEEADAKFGFLLEAFKYGTPPHAGLAFGLDRLVTLMLGLEDIRDVIAFPKMQNASELMTNCPAPGEEKALKELAIAVTDVEADE